MYSSNPNPIDLFQTKNYQANVRHTPPLHGGGGGEGGMLSCSPNPDPRPYFRSIPIRQM